MTDRLLTTREVAQILRVCPTTITRWAASGLLPDVPTPGHHRRFREADIKALLSVPAPEAATS